MFTTYKKSFLMIGLLLTFMLVMVGCGAANKEKTEEPKDEATKTEEAKTVTVEHAMGTTEVPAEAKKVVILTNEGTEALLAMGVTPVGAVNSWTGDPWYDHITDEMKDVTPVGTESEVNVEAIAALEPDLIIGNKMRQEAVYEQLNAIAPTVFAETLRGEWQENFKLYAQALNKVDEGEKVLAEYDARIKEFSTALGDKIDTKVSIVRFMADHARIYHKDSFSGVILEQIGLKRPQEQDLPDFMEKATKERIPAMEGDILFYFTYEPGDGAATKNEEEWINDPLFKNLEVAKAGKVYKVDDTIWNTAGGVLAANLLLDDLEKHFLEQ
ncbi:ABC transporter substrate-binding protein [Bacillus suaedaesalsae]|uniref:Iron-siderophore ABC transporter substrate-binding protein n=1 Tax=Bacillus suaedaesalsae TaxID=2810349 RepID=A0ABS2DLJ2_9BACI|nr:iron-siderophore ABC transporter substrate-binding protein [Bacillus suaedaesalsae]MBM6618915.1 iron-siderophore ABC transporter substrate-binding protein [Bacillus suaedaesalsae]